MGLAALLLAIGGGLTGLSLAAYGHVAIALLGLGGLSEAQQNLARAIVWGLPIASFVGAGTVMSSPGFSTLLLGAVAFGWYLIGAQFGYGFNIFTNGAIILNGIAAALALGAAASKSPGQSSSDDGRVRITREAALPEPQTSETYDRKRWEALLRYDEDLNRVAQLFAPLGPKWTDRLAADYLAINDKQYLGDIARKIMAEVRAERQVEQERAEQQHLEARPPAVEARRSGNALPGMLLVLFPLVIALGAFIWFGRTGPAVTTVQGSGGPAVTTVQGAPAAVAAPSPQRYAFEFSKVYPSLYASLRAAIPNNFANSPDFAWLYELNGVAGPIFTETQNGRVYLGGSVCKPHDCYDNRLVFAVSADGSRAIGTVRSSHPGVFFREIATKLPLDNNERQLLERLSDRQN